MKKYLDTFWLRLVLVLLMTGIGVWLFLEKNWLWLSVTLMVALWAIVRFYRLYTYNTRKVAFLLDAIENDDPAVHFYEKVADEDNSKVNVMLNRIARILQRVKQETIQREKYYELIMDFVDTGIVVIDEKGSVFQKNRKAMKLLGMEVLTHVKQLSRISDALETAFREAMPGQKQQVEYTTERGVMNLSMRVSGITFKDNSLRIIALNDINRELDEREIDSWIRLTRVLTHEIMNSLTPVTSLSETLLALPIARKDEELYQGLETIHTTGKGLIHFVTSYRKLTRLPSPKPTLFYVRPFLARMVQLATHQHTCPHIRMSVEEIPDDLIVFADENLLTQVVTNLLKNAVQAIGHAFGEIRLRAYCDEQESVRIEVSNDGPKIPPEIIEQIFVPFFTTKEEGSGIGLSLSKQIMRLSGGSLVLLPYSSTGRWTTFVMVLN